MDFLQRLKLCTLQSAQNLFKCMYMFGYQLKNWPNSHNSNYYKKFHRGKSKYLHFTTIILPMRNNQTFVLFFFNLTERAILLLCGECSEANSSTLMLPDYAVIKNNAFLYVTKVMMNQLSIVDSHYLNFLNEPLSKKSSLQLGFIGSEKRLG